MVNNIPWDCTNWTGPDRHFSSTKEIEIRNRDMGAGGDAETNPNINNNSSRSAGMKALKLPPFNEDIL